MSKPLLSGRLLGLKFMQRAQEKVEKAEAEDAAEERDAEVRRRRLGSRCRHSRCPRTARCPLPAAHAALFLPPPSHSANPPLSGRRTGWWRGRDRGAL